MSLKLIQRKNEKMNKEVKEARHFLKKRKEKEPQTEEKEKEKISSEVELFIR